MNKIVPVLLFILSFNSISAQHKYWITFKDKEVSSYHYQDYLSAEAIANRSKFGIPLHQYSDIPVKSAYVKEINSKGIQSHFTSRWLNSLSVVMTKEQAEEIKKLDF